MNSIGLSIEVRVTIGVRVWDRVWFRAYGVGMRLFNWVLIWFEDTYASNGWE